MYSLTLYYSVNNGGDGSAYPQFTTNKDFARIHQEIVNLGEGWGEPCTGEITLESESEIKIQSSGQLITKDELKEGLSYIAESTSHYYRSGAKEQAKILLEELENIQE
jgi:hypothetical protein